MTVDRSTNTRKCLIISLSIIDFKNMVRFGWSFSKWADFCRSLQNIFFIFRFIGSDFFSLSLFLYLCASFFSFRWFFRQPYSLICSHPNFFAAAASDSFSLFVSILLYCYCPIVLAVFSLSIWVKNSFLLHTAWNETIKKSPKRNILKLVMKKKPKIFKQKEKR